MIPYEQASRDVLIEAAIALDPKRQGTALDVGVGNDMSYLARFVEEGFPTLAVEPLPADGLRDACLKLGVVLEVAAISGADGYVMMYLGQWNGKLAEDLSSLHADWWASGPKMVRVASVRLDSLLAKYDIERVSILKMDVEGSELGIIRQLTSLPCDLLPSAVQFEYGGGDYKASQRRGWNKKYFSKTCACLQTLRSLGYGRLTLVDRELPVRSTPLDSDDLASFFLPQSHVGNAIVT